MIVVQYSLQECQTFYDGARHVFIQADSDLLSCSLTVQLWVTQNWTVLSNAWFVQRHVAFVRLQEASARAMVKQFNWQTTLAEVQKARGRPAWDQLTAQAGSSTASAAISLADCASAGVRKRKPRANALMLKYILLVLADENHEIWAAEKSGQDPF